VGAALGKLFLPLNHDEDPVASQIPTHCDFPGGAGNADKTKRFSIAICAVSHGVQWIASRPKQFRKFAGSFHCGGILRAGSKHGN